MEEKKRLSGKEKFAYGIGAVGKDMVYMLSASYILYYYQDIMGVSAWVMGIILLIARVFDAFNDPLMGVLVAKTKTRWGKFRPWLFIGTLTNAVIMFLMFSAPPTLDGAGLIAYAAVFYIMWGVTYTMMDIPYWSMIPAFTEGGKERENLSAMARTCAGVGSALITILTVMAVTFIGNLATSKSTDVQTYETSNAHVYVAELDEAGGTTGNVITIDEGISISVTADRSQFTDSYSYNTNNSDYTLTIAGYTFSNDTLDEEGTTAATYDFAMDGVNEEAAVILYVNEEQYQTIASGDQSVVLTITSTKDVERLGFKYFSLIVCILFFVFILITCIFVKEKSTVDLKPVKIKDMFRSLIQNDQAMAVVITIILVNVAVYITSNLLIYFFKYDLGGSNWSGNYTLFNTFGGAMQILAMMAFFPLLRKFFPTIKMFFVVVGAAIFGYVVLLIMALTGVNSVYLFFIPGFFIMSAVGVLNVLVTIFLANTVDYGELKNNRRDESVIFSMQTFVVKLASGISALIASICLNVFSISDSSATIEAVDGSYLAGLKTAVAAITKNGATVVSNNSLFGLRMVMTVVPVLVLIVAVIIFKKNYKLDDNKLKEISLQIQEKRTAEAE